MKTKNDLTNKTFCRWKVLPQIRYKNDRKQWLCVCSCEKRTEKYVDEQNLLRGCSKSCGCLSQERARANHIDLSGRWFGELEVISKAENKNGRVAWNCKCKCGNLVVVTSHQLIQKKTKSCGGSIHRKGHIRDLTNQDLGAMEALYPTEKRDGKGSVIWHSRCKKCGREKELSEDALVHGNYKSCGCTRFDQITSLTESMHFYDGTCLEMLRRKMRSDNKTGVTGVVKINNGKYSASICFQGKTYFLGRYETLTEAAAVRKRAEETLHQPFIKAYSSWMEDENKSQTKFIFEVDYVDGEFQIYSNYR